MQKLNIFLLTVIIILLNISCQNSKKAETKTGGKTGVLIISHGSHSKTWRETLWQVGETVKPEILKNSNISDVRTAYMEYVGPSIADQLKKFDEEGFKQVIIVPMFLTVSSHTADDIQNIVGIQKNPEVLETLKEEKIEVYEPKAKVVITPLLDFAGYLKKNVVRRYNQISENHDNEGVVLVAYGSEPYNQQWIELITEIGQYFQIQTEVVNVSYSWCGHIVSYDTKPTTQAIESILEKEEKAVVIPVLVAVDEHFQGGIIKNAIEAIDNYYDKVIYIGDAILPDQNINQWIIDIVNETVQ